MVVMNTIEGRITHRRAISKKLVFYDICRTDTQDGSSSATEDCIQSWVEVVIKLGSYGSSIQHVKDLRDTLKLGDIVSVTGTFESSHVMQAVSVTLLQAWRDQHPLGVAFIPQPSPLHHQAKQTAGQQNHQQQAHAGGCSADPSQPIAIAQQTAAAAAHSSALPGQCQAPGSAAAATVQQPQLAVCKFWVNTGRCAKGAACPYAHLADSRTTWVSRRRGERQLLSSHLGLSHDADSAAAKGKRAQVFAAWLVNTFGKDTLNAGSGVLDVAGGAGGMTYELSVVHGIKCTLVDPRPLKLNKQQHKQLQAAGPAAELQLWSAAQLQQGNNLQAELKQLTHHKQLNEQPQGQQEQIQQNPLVAPQVQVQVQQQQQQHPTAWQQPLVVSDLLMPSMPHQLQHSKPVQEMGRTSPPAAVQFCQVQGWFGPELWGSSAFQQLFGNCSLVIGLHPDEATEAIVDFALELGCPFAVMPCCVFPRLFPNRRLQKDGQLHRVESYADLVEYLTAKGRGKQEVLSFVGANVVVYRQA